MNRSNQGILLGVMALVLALVGFYLMQRIMFHRWQLWYQLQRGGSPAQAFVMNRQEGDDGLPTVTYRFKGDGLEYFYSEAVEREVWDELNPGSIVQIDYTVDDNGRLYSRIKGNSKGLMTFSALTALFWIGVLFLVYRAVVMIGGKPEFSSPPQT
ncbi:MAG TPA: DUF3592 domain-containing protein [Aggregatilineales bacterium]|nr:DUF3592 domain-containing protein [Aggregatilineales bacterium]